MRTSRRGNSSNRSRSTKLITYSVRLLHPVKYERQPRNNRNEMFTSFEYHPQVNFGVTNFIDYPPTTKRYNYTVRFKRTNN